MRRRESREVPHVHALERARRAHFSSVDPWLFHRSIFGPASVAPAVDGTAGATAVPNPHTDRPTDRGRCSYPHRKVAGREIGDQTRAGTRAGACLGHRTRSAIRRVRERPHEPRWTSVIRP